MGILATLLATGVGGTATAAPLPTRSVVVVEVPFTFQVAGRSFPAGEYRFEQMLGNTEGFDVLVVRGLGPDGQFYAAVGAKAEKMDDSKPATQIVFRRSGENLVLAEVCSRNKHAILRLSGAAATQPITTAKDEDVVLPVPSDGELVATATPTR